MRGSGEDHGAEPVFPGNGAAGKTIPVHEFDAAPGMKKVRENEAALACTREIFFRSGKQFAHSRRAAEARIAGAEFRHDVLIPLLVADDMLPQRQADADAKLMVRQRTAQRIRLPERVMDQIGHDQALVLRACSMSAQRSSTCSIPTENRTSPSVTPAASRISFGMDAWVMVAGWQTRDSMPPRLSA